MEQKLCYGCMKPKSRSPVCEHCGFDERQQNRQHQLPVGTLLHNQYILGRVLGQGGFGITYIGWDQLLEMPVAIKEYFPNGIVYRNTASGTTVDLYSRGDEQMFLKHKDRFLREARTLAQLSSLPEIVQVKNFFEENNTAYIVMEYVEGITLKNHLRRLGRPMTVAEAMNTMEPVLRGLARVHEKGLVHRDISPDNIMLQSDGSVKLIDFGTVRALNDFQRTNSTESVLKPGFAPMEQYNTNGNIGPWTDVYALCATYHYCMTGKLPPDAPSRIEGGDRLTLLESVPGMPRAMIQVLQKGMAIRSADRIQSVEELRQKIYSVNMRQSTPTFINNDIPDDLGSNNQHKQKKLLMIIGAVAAAVLAVVMFIGFSDLGSSGSTASAGNRPAAATEAAVQAPAVDESLWIDNLLMHDSFDSGLEDYSESRVFDHPSARRRDIRTVTFLASRESAPSYCWDVSYNQDGSVVAWVEDSGYSSARYDLYIAANGGINGQYACQNMFDEYVNVIQINFNGAFHTDYSENMSYMFSACRSLIKVDLRSLDTSSCTNMFAMFDDCVSVTELDVSGFDTANVTDMALMFADCESVRALDVTGFDTANVIDMAFMFCDCAMVTTLDVSGFDTADVWDMSYMFHGCNSLTSLNLGSFSTASVTENTSFYHQERLPDGTSWRTLFEPGRGSSISSGSSASSSTSYGWQNNILMRDGFDSDVDDSSDSMVMDSSYVRRRDVRTVTFVDSLAQMPSNCWDVSANGDGSVMAWVKDSGHSGAKYDLYIGGNGGVNGVYACDHLFAEYVNLVEIKFGGNFHTEQAEVMDYMFSACESLERVDLQYLNTSGCTSMFAMFDDCFRITTLDVSGFDTSNVTDMALMFCDCTSVRALDVSGFDTRNVIDMAFMFCDCEAVTSLDISGFDTADVWDMSYMFHGCKSLTSLNLGSFNTASVTDNTSFYHKDQLPNGTHWETLF